MPLIAEYLLHLGRHDQATKAFHEDPKTAMSSFGLTEEQQEAITSGDEQRLGTAITAEFAASSSRISLSMTTSMKKLQ